MKNPIPNISIIPLIRNRSTIYSLILMLFLFSAFGGKSQTYILQETFEGTFPPTGWTLNSPGSSYADGWMQGTSTSTYCIPQGSKTMSTNWATYYTNNAWAFTPGLALTAGTVYKISFKQCVKSPSNNKTESLKITVGSNATQAGQTTTLLDLPTLTNTTSVSRSATYTPSTSGTFYFAFNCYSAANMRYLSIDSVSVSYTAPPSPCAGTPAPGNTLSTLTTACPSDNFTLSFQNSIPGSGVTYQWMKSADGSNWSAIGSATSASLSTTQTSANYYRCEATCSGSTGTSAAVFVNYGGPVYATLPLNQGFESWINSCGGTTNAPGTSLSTTPTTGNNAWRRNDQGASATWSSATYGVYNPTFSQGSYSARFHSTYATSGQQGSIDTYVNCSNGASTKRITFDYINTNGSDVLAVLVSTDGGLTFTQIGANFTTSNPWTSKVIDFTSSSAETIVRLRATSDYGSTDLGVDNLKIVTVSNCLVPVALSTTGLTSSSVNFSWTAPSPAPSNGYDWEIRSSGAAGSGSTGLTESGSGISILIPVNSLGSLTTYTAYVRSKCTSENSDWVSIGFTTLPGENDLPTGYCWPSVQMACFYGDKITRVQLAGIDHADASCSSDPDGKKDFTALTPAQVFVGTSNPMSITVENALGTGTEYLRGWIDFNRDGIFSAAESFNIGMGTGNTVVSTNVPIPSTAIAGLTRMRIMYRRTSTLAAGDACHSIGSFRGQVKDYAVKINVIPPPPNDIPCNAASLTIASAEPILTEYTTIGATDGTISTLSCVAGVVGDVWFKTIVPSTGTFSTNVTNGTAGNLAGAIYTTSDNTCTGTFTELVNSCNNDGGPGTAPWFSANDITPGQAVWIRIAMTSAAEARGTFNIGLSEGLYWTANINSDFNTAANWLYKDSAPDANTTVIVPANASLQPTVNGTASVRNIRFINTANDATITLATSAVLNLGIASTTTFPSFISGNLSKGIINGAGELKLSGQSVKITSPLTVSAALTRLGTNTIVESNGNLTLENGILISGNFGGASFGHVQGEINYNRTRNAQNYQYSYFSSPVSGDQASAIGANNATYQAIYQYNALATAPASNLDVQQGWVAMNLATPLLDGRGYISRNVSTAKFTGEVHENSTYSVTPLNSTMNKWNLVGNPYTSPIALGPSSLANTFCNQNSANLAGQSLYFWDDSNNNNTGYELGGYMVYNGLTDLFVSSGTTNHNAASVPKLASVGQGFFVNTLNNSNILFNQEQRRIGDNSVFYETAIMPLIKLKMTNSENIISEVIVAFSEHASDSFDELYDAEWLQGNPTIGFYSFVDGHKTLANIMGGLTSEKTADLGIVNQVNGSTIISAEIIRDFDPSTIILLEDLKTGSFHQILEHSVYEFQNDSEENSGSRFRLHFLAPLVIEITNNCLGQGLGSIEITNPNSKPLSVSLISSDGLIVANIASFSGSEIIDNLMDANYILNLIYSNCIPEQIPVIINASGNSEFTTSAFQVNLNEALVSFEAQNSNESLLTWDFGDGTILIGQKNAIHTYESAGIYTVGLRVSDECESFSEQIITVMDAVTGMEETSKDSKLIFYPNPAKDQAFILFNGIKDGKSLSISIYNSAGLLIKKFEKVPSKGGFSFSVNEFPSGIYQVIISGKSYHENQRLTIIK